jgi:hypothetical protein
MTRLIRCCSQFTASAALSFEAFMQLNPLAFNALISNLGQTLSWRKAYACPCINPNSGAAKPGCPVCGSKGRFWSIAVTGDAGIAGQQVQLEWAQFSTAELGDVVMSLPSDSPVYEMSQFDRVVLMDSSSPFSIPLTRGMNDTLRFPIVKIDRVFWISPANVIIEGSIPTVGDDGVMTWTTGEPPAGQTYSITGRRRPEYFVYTDFPQDRAHHHGADLPRKVVMRKFDLFGR